MRLELDVNEYLPLRDVVFSALRKAILMGELQPGERLLEVKLAETLGVSRTPVREAIRMLELEGLVNMVPRKGAEVADITIEDLRDELEVRRALEVLSVELACERIDDKGREELIFARDDFKEAIRSKDVTTIVEKDENFHDVIFRASGNKKLVTTAQNLREQVYRFRYEYVKDFEFHSKLIDEHDRITDAVLKGDKAEAASVMRIHIYDQQQTVVQNLLKEHGRRGRKGSY